MQLFKRGNKRERGHAMTEMALTLPIILILVMGIMDFGRALFIYSQLSNAAREGARWGSVQGVIPQGGIEQYRDCVSIRAAVVDKFGLALDLKPEDIVIEYDDGVTLLSGDCNGTVGPAADTIQQGDRIRVTIKTEFAFITPFVSSFISTVPISFTAARTILKGGALAEPPIG